MPRHMPRMITLVLPLLLVAGCPRLPDDPGDTNPDGDAPFLDESGNGTFKSATALPLENAASLSFRGTIDSATDIDIFTLGSLRAGDRVVVDVQRTGGNLDPVISVFDEDEDIQAFNDDREADGSDLDPYLDILIRGQDGDYFLAIAGFGGLSTGDYAAFVQIERGDGGPAGEPAIIFLDWDGGAFTSETLGSFNLPEFDATQVGLRSDQTQTLKDQVYAVVTDRYADYQITFVSSDDSDPPAEPHSTVYFGGDSSRAFALAEHIDVHNQDKTDVAIIFTEAYADAFAFTPTLSQMANAIGNTVAHEVGHLLGLVHTSDCGELMDATCYNEALLLDQTFDRAEIDIATFPTGYQNAAELLAWILGLNL